MDQNIAVNTWRQQGVQHCSFALQGEICQARIEKSGLDPSEFSSYRQLFKIHSKTREDTLPIEVLKTLKQNTTCEKFSFLFSFSDCSQFIFTIGRDQYFAVRASVLWNNLSVRSVRTYDWLQHKSFKDFYIEAFIWIYLQFLSHLFFFFFTNKIYIFLKRSQKLCI